MCFRLTRRFLIVGNFSIVRAWVKKKILFVVFAFLSNEGSFGGAVAINRFVVQDQVQVSKSSKNSLKQDIGVNIKEALHCCTSISKELAEVQKVLADIQSKLLSKIEDLIEDKSVFRKSGKSDLSRSVSVAARVSSNLKGLKETLSSQKNKINELDASINEDNCLKTSKKTV